MNYQVGVVRGELIGPLTFHHDLYGVTPRLDLNFEMHSHCDTERVKPGPHIGDGSRDAHTYCSWHCDRITWK